MDFWLVSVFGFVLKKWHFGDFSLVLLNEDGLLLGRTSCFKWLARAGGFRRLGPRQLDGPLEAWASEMGWADWWSRKTGQTLGCWVERMGHGLEQAGRWNWAGQLGWSSGLAWAWGRS